MRDSLIGFNLQPLSAVNRSKGGFSNEQWLCCLQFGANCPYREQNRARFQVIYHLFYRPFHMHDEEQLLHAGEIVPVDVEIWPTSIVFEVGYHLVLEVGAQDKPTARLRIDDPTNRLASRFVGQNMLLYRRHLSIVLAPANYSIAFVVIAQRE